MDVKYGKHPPVPPGALCVIGLGDSGHSSEFLAALMIGFAAWVSWRYALTTGDPAGAEVVFPAMTGVAYPFIHAELAAARRDHRAAHESEGTR